jgi:outer membrane lipoprotein-sorting protein
LDARRPGLKASEEMSCKHKFFGIGAAIVLIFGPTAVGGQNTAGTSGKAATELLQKTLLVYQKAKSYSGDWVFLLKEGEALTKMNVELRSKGPTRLLYNLRLAADKEGKVPNSPSIPELKVVLDGKTAWFENTTARVFYKVNLPKNPVTSPLMFFPQMSTVGGAERGDDQKEGDRTIAVIFAKTKSGGLSRMEIDAANNHIVRIASDETTGITRILTTLTIDKETFDGEISDDIFTYKPDKAFKEIPAPSEAAVIIGSAPDKTEKPGKDK